MLNDCSKKHKFKVGLKPIQFNPVLFEIVSGFIVILIFAWLLVSAIQ